MSSRPDLLARVEALRERAGAMVAATRAQDPEPDDPFRGLYVADHHVDRVLHGSLVPEGAHSGRSGSGSDPSGEGLAFADGGHIPADHHGHGDDGTNVDDRSGDPLSLLAERAGLTGVDVGVLVAALAPDLDPGFEKLYVYLNDDITRRRASVGLALRLAGVPPWAAPARARLLAGAPLVDLRLLEVEDPERPFLTRGLRVPDHVLQHLLGYPAAPPDVTMLTVPPASWPDDDPMVERLARIFTGSASRGSGFLHLHDNGEAGGLDLAGSVLAKAGLDALCIDVGRAPPEGIDPDPVMREVVLRGVGLVVASAERAQPDLLRSLVEHTPAVVVVARDSWDPGVAARTPVSVEVAPAAMPERRALWWNALEKAGLASDNGSGSATGADPATGAPVQGLDPLRLSPGAIHRAVTAAADLARVDGNALDVNHLREAARLQASPRLERLARRIRPGVSWDDLVVDPLTRADLELLVVRIRHRERVLDDWQLRRRSGHAEGVSALFAGDSGTGKTLAAEVMAAELGLELYVIDLSTVVDKYVGETEKNLERIFTEAEGVNGILFFDEADALFGKRSEVSDARDRYANTEIAYLLQRIESFDGVAILATNLRGNVDDAFLRRLAAVVDFPDPDGEQRRRLWNLHLGSVPDDGGVDLEFLAKAFTLSGGNIRNVSVTAAYMAAARNGVVTMNDLVQAVALEYRKLGRLLDESEFGPWVGVLTEEWNSWTPEPLEQDQHEEHEEVATDEQARP